MSATGRSDVRHPLDAYQTPAWAIDSIREQIVWGENPSILEPCSGDGNITGMLILRGVARRIEWAEVTKGRDFLEIAYPQRFDFIITNPPFSLAREFIEKSLTIANCVVMLLRLNFLGSQSRKELWEKHPPTAIHVLTKRPSFTGHGTDATDYAWFVWDTTGRQKRGMFWL
jgi:hypothetical protein